eukprot:jgi/Psemu1/68405/estExt_Genemark1.C_4940019
MEGTNNLGCNSDTDLDIGIKCSDSLDDGDISIATNSSASVSVASDVDVDVDVTEKFARSTIGHSNGKHPNRTTKNDDDDDDDDADAFLSDIDGNASESDDDCASISDDDFEYQQEVPLAAEVERNRHRGYSLDSDDDDDDFDSPIEVPLKSGSDDDGEIRRPGNFHRRAPQRTKSGDGITAEDGDAALSGGPSRRVGSFSRRPPPRTKSGEGVIPGPPMAGPEHRSPPLRTKSGAVYGTTQRQSHHQRRISGDGLGPGRYSHRVIATITDGDVPGGSNRTPGASVVPLDSDDDDDGDDGAVPLPSSEAAEYRAMALERNAARRQKSSDMLGAMREATKKAPRNTPARSKSNAAAMSGGRRAPMRSKSESPDNANAGGIFSPPGRQVQRRAPPRTKTGDGLLGNVSPRGSSMSGLSSVQRPPEVSL